MIVWLAYFIGIIAGTLLTCVFSNLRTSRGQLLIDPTNPDLDVYRIVVHDLDDLKKSKKLSLKIVKNVDLSQQ